jgi:hypothetical protein
MDDSQREDTGDDFQAAVGDVSQPSTPAESPVEPQLTRRRHALRLAATLGALFLALLVILDSIPSLRDRAVGVVFPSPTPTLFSSADLFYLLPSPPGTTVLLDGHSLARLAYPGDPHSLRLPRGHHTLAWRSATFPFQPLSCTISLPRVPADTCPFVLARMVQLLPKLVQKNISLSPVIAVHETSDALPLDQFNALTAAIQDALAALRSSAIVQPGEDYYSYQPGQCCKPVAATRSLRATLHVNLAGDLGDPCLFSIDPCWFPGQDCAHICTVPAPVSASTGTTPAWLAAVLVDLTWEYTTLDGQSIANVAEYGYGIQRVVLRITWDGAHWLVVPVTGHQPSLPAADDLTCASALAWFSQGPPTYILFPETSNGVDFRYAAGPTPTDGCILRIAATGNPQVQVVAPGAPALFLERFGVLLAANDAAHSLWPDLPVADASEQALAQQLAAQLGP